MLLMVIVALSIFMIVRGLHGAALLRRGYARGRPISPSDEYVVGLMLAFGALGVIAPLMM